MDTEGRARSMRAEGATFRRIGEVLGISHVSAYFLCGGQRSTPRPALRPTEQTVVRYAPHNGGASTTSGMVPISMPRIPTLHGVAA